MTIEQSLERIATALESLNVLAGAKPSAAKPSAAKPSAAKPKKSANSKDSDITMDQVRDVLHKVIKKRDPEAAKSILEQHGASRISELPPEAYPLAYAAAQEALGE